MSESKKNWLGQITSDITKRGTQTVISGGEGVGKTSTAAHFPDPVFLVTVGEDSLGVLQRNGEIPNTPSFPPMTTYMDAVGALTELVNSPKNPQTLVLDALDGFEALAMYHVRQTEFGGSNDRFTSYNKGWFSTHDVWRQFLSLLADIAKQGTNVIILAHIEVKKVPNPEGLDYDRWQPAANKGIWALTSRWCDNILMLSCIQSVKEDGTQSGKGKAVGTSERILYAAPHPARVCKNRHGMKEQNVLGSSPKAAAKVIADALNL